jgi:hypothetical protein
MPPGGHARRAASISAALSGRLSEGKERRMDLLDLFAMGGILGILFTIFLITLLPTIFYLLTLHRALNKCAVESRTMTPALVWLQLIPIFDLIWQFYIVINVGRTLGNEFRKRNIKAEQNPGQSIGLAMCILQLCGAVPVVGIPAAIVGFLLWIYYWIKIYGYSSKLG